MRAGRGSDRVERERAVPLATRRLEGGVARARPDAALRVDRERRQLLNRMGLDDHFTIYSRALLFFCLVYNLYNHNNEAGVK